MVHVLEGVVLRGYIQGEAMVPLGPASPTVGSAAMARDSVRSNLLQLTMSPFGRILLSTVATKFFS